MQEIFRGLVLLVVVVALGISSFFRSRARAGETIDRRREGLPWMVARFSVALPLLLSIVAFIIRPGWIGWAEIPVPLWLRWLGALAAVAALPCVFALFSSIGGNISETVLTKQHHQLITTGPYRWVRHPLYSVSLVMLAGIALMAGSGLILALVAIAWFGVMAFIIPSEEANLLARFGTEYERYRARTGKLVPRFF